MLLKHWIEHSLTSFCSQAKLPRRSTSDRGRTKEVLSPEDPDVAQLLSNVCVWLLYIFSCALIAFHIRLLLFASQGKHIEAEELFKRSVATHEDALGFNDPDLASLLANLAGSLSSQVGFLIPALFLLLTMFLFLLLLSGWRIDRAHQPPYINAAKYIQPSDSTRACL